MSTPDIHSPNVSPSRDNVWIAWRHECQSAAIARAYSVIMRTFWHTHYHTHLLQRVLQKSPNHPVQRSSQRYILECITPYMKNTQHHIHVLVGVCYLFLHWAVFMCGDAVVRRSSLCRQGGIHKRKSTLTTRLHRGTTLSIDGVNPSSCKRNRGRKGCADEV